MLPNLCLVENKKKGLYKLELGMRARSKIGFARLDRPGRWQLRVEAGDSDSRNCGMWSEWKSSITLQVGASKAWYMK